MELQNLNPGLTKMLLPGAALATVLTAILGITAAYSVVNPPSAGGVGGPWLFLVLFVAVSIAMSVVVLGTYRSYRAAAPDAVLIDREKVVGIYGRHLFGPAAGERRTIPLSAITEVKSGSYGIKGQYDPAQIRADSLGVEGFDPKTALQLVEGPKVPPGMARRFYVSDANLAAIREAWEDWKAQR